MNFDTQQSRKLETSIAPMIDIIFLLLVFFLITSQLIQASVDAHVQLPKMAAARQLTSIGERTILNLRADGQVFVSGQAVSEEELRALLAANMAARGEEERSSGGVTLRADRRVSCERIMEIGRLCQAVGVGEIEIRAEGPGQTSGR